MLPKDKDAQISRFWEKYIEISKNYGAKQDLIRWHVKHAEQYIKAHKTQLKSHASLDLDKYLQDKGRNTQLKDWHDVRLLILCVFYLVMSKQSVQALHLIHNHL